MIWAVEELPTGGDSTQIILAVLVLVGVIVTAVGGAVAAWLARGGRTEPSPPAADPAASQLGQDVAVLRVVVDRTEDAVEVLDRRVDRLEATTEVADRRLDRLERWQERRTEGGWPS